MHTSFVSCPPSYPTLNMPDMAQQSFEVRSPTIRPVVQIDDVDDDESDGERDNADARVQRWPWNDYDGADFLTNTPSPLRGVLADFYFSGATDSPGAAGNVGLAPPHSRTHPLDSTSASPFASRDMIGTIEEESEHGSSPSSRRSSAQQHVVDDHHEPASRQSLEVSMRSSQDHALAAHVLHTRSASLESGVKVAGAAAPDPTNAAHAPDTELSPRQPYVSSNDTSQSEEWRHSRYATADTSPHPAKSPRKGFPSPTVGGLAWPAPTSQDHAMLATLPLSPSSRPRRGSASSIKATAGSLRRLSRSFTRLSPAARSTSLKSSSSMKSISASSDAAVSAGSGSVLLGASPRDEASIGAASESIPPSVSPSDPSSVPHHMLPQRSSSLRKPRDNGKARALDDDVALDTAWSKRPAWVGVAHDAQEGYSDAPAKRSSWRKRLSSITSSASRPPTQASPHRQRTHSVAALEAIAAPLSPDQEPLSSSTFNDRRPTWRQSLVARLPDVLSPAARQVRANSQHDAAGDAAMAPQVAAAMLQDRYMAHHRRGYEGVRVPIDSEHSVSSGDSLSATRRRLSEVSYEDATAARLLTPPVATSEQFHSLRRRPNFLSSREGFSSTSYDSGAAMQFAVGHEDRSPRPVQTPPVDPPLLARKRSKSFDGYGRLPLSTSSAPPRRTRSARRPNDAQQLSSRVPDSVVVANSPQQQQNQQHRSRPTSVVVGPFALELPEDAIRQQSTPRNRRFSLPVSLDYNAAGLRSSSRFAREKVLMRRSLRRHNVNLGVGMTVPLQLSFAAGLAWDRKLDNERSAVARRSESAHHVSPPWIDSLALPGSPSGTVADTATETATEAPHDTDHSDSHCEESELRRTAARQQSMALLLGVGARGRARSISLNESARSNGVGVVGGGNVGVGGVHGGGGGSSSSGSSVVSVASDRVIAIGRRGSEQQRRRRRRRSQARSDTLHYYTAAVKGEREARALELPCSLNRLFRCLLLKAAAQGDSFADTCSFPTLPLTRFPLLLSS